MKFLSVFQLRQKKEHYTFNQRMTYRAKTHSKQSGQCQCEACAFSVKSKDQLNYHRADQSASKYQTSPSNNNSHNHYLHQSRNSSPSLTRTSNNDTTNNVIQLTDLMSKQPDDILLELTNPCVKFNEYLNSDQLGRRLTIQTIQVIEKSLECSSMRVKQRHLLDEIANSNFFQTHVHSLINERNERNEYDVNLIRTVMNI